jgi:hypothetical protein
VLPDPIDRDSKGFSALEARLVDEIVGKLAKPNVSTYAGIPVVTCDLLPEDVWFVVGDIPKSADVLRAYEEPFKRKVERRRLDWAAAFAATDPRAMVKLPPVEVCGPSAYREVNHTEHFEVYRAFMDWEGVQWPDT